MDKRIKAVLNELMETSRDGEKGFNKSAEEVTDPQLKSAFLRQGRHCAEAARELAEQLRMMGGDVEDGGSVSGAIHRGWVEVKAAVTGHDTAAILAETERGEDYAKKVYKEALEEDLPADLRDLIERQYRGVIANHDEVRDLRDTYRSRN
ncbi:MAG: PA2169 family four-helix-bundle protein [Steroidobacteraceae bacterium]